MTDGTFVLTRDDETQAIGLYDVRAGTIVAECTPPGHCLLLSGAYDATARSVAFKGWKEPWAVVAGETIGDLPLGEALASAELTIDST